MDRRDWPMLVDGAGVPFSPETQDVLLRMVPRLLRQFPQLQDGMLLVEVLEEAGRRVVRRQDERGAIANVHGFAWVTVRNVALARLARGSSQVAQHTLPAAESAKVLATLPTPDGSPEAIERGLFLREAFAQLSPDEQQLVAWKHGGCSSEWIAAKQGRSVGAVNTAFTRAKQRLRQILSARAGDRVRDFDVPWLGIEDSENARNRPGDARRLPHASDWLVPELRPWLVDEDA